MITSFACKETEKIFNGVRSSTFPPEIQRRISNKLIIMSEAADVFDLRNPPGNNLEMLHGNRAGQYSIRINNQFRICFVWNNGNMDNVEVVDYH